MCSRFSAHIDKAQLSWKDYSIEVACDINLADDGEVRISIDPILVSHDNIWVVRLQNANQYESQSLTIKGTDSEGRLLWSDSTYLNSFSSRFDQQGHRYELQLGAMELEVTPSSSTIDLEGYNPCQAEYFTIGQEGFHEIIREVELGTVAIYGEHRIANFDHITGEIIIAGKCKSNELTQWYIDAERLADRLLGGLSIAQGRRIYWSVRRQCVGGRLDCLTLAGSRPTSPPLEPLFSILNLEPIVETVLENYTDKLIEKTGLEIALDWYLAHPRFIEAEFLTSMTALEHLVNIYIDQAESRAVLPKNEFRKLHEKLKSVISSEITRMTSEGVQLLTSSSELIEMLQKGLGNLNRYPLRQNIRTMLNDYDVPIKGIEHHIDTIVRIRNDIVHRGTPGEDTLAGQSLFSYLVVLRELLKRIFLTLLCYEGEYQTELGGWRWTQFPP